MVAVYNFTTVSGSQVFANFGWVGMIGSLAGFSNLIGLGERKWSNDNEKEVGTPWMYVLRDVL